MNFKPWTFRFLGALAITATASPGLAEGKTLWYEQPAQYWASQSLPIGNGKLGASVFGGIQKDHWVLNIDSLWLGGPYENPNYNGVNPTQSKVEIYEDIQQAVFANGTVPVSAISPFLGSDSNYGSFTMLGNMTVELDLDEGEAADYKLWLDLNTGLGGSQFSTNSHGTIKRQYFCSYPAKACIYHVKSTAPLPRVSIGLEAIGREPQPNITSSRNILQMRGRAQAQNGMLYDSRVALIVPGSKVDFSAKNGQLVIPASAKATEFYLAFTGDTEYDESKGTAASGYSFRGSDPAATVQAIIHRNTKKSIDKLITEHVKDHKQLFETFSITIPDPLNSANKPTDKVVAAYSLSAGGDPYLESLLFDFGRYLLISSSRDNSLPPNLQGKWSNGYWAPWSGDYHTNINLQMNLWGSEATGLGGLLDGTWRHMLKTWAPRGAETAKTLYGAEGWVIHNELNIFGSTGVKGGDTGGSHWHFYNAANAWMMQHVWDHYDYSRDVEWFRTIGYPLLKGVAKFQMSILTNDEYFNDGSLVIAPCNSPEQHPTTFGCAVNQQQIWEVLTNILKGWEIAGDIDVSFKKKVQSTLEKMDNGVHVGRYGQIQEWKMDIDDPADQHRHLSHLHGWYPGFAISSAHKRNSTVIKAAETTLSHRGPGNWLDANAGWAKVWRSACWAQFQNATQAHYILGYALQENFAENLFSIYGKGGSPANWVFQIDANFGWVGAMLAMFVTDLDLDVGEFGNGKGKREVVLAPAVSKTWWPAKVEGVRIRGGGRLSFEVDGAGEVRNVRFGGRRTSSGSVVFVDGKGRRLVANQ